MIRLNDAGQIVEGWGSQQTRTPWMSSFRLTKRSASLEARLIRPC